MKKQEEFMMKRLVLIVVPLVAFALLAMTASAGDHFDSPSATGDPAADISDVYAFRSPENSDNLVVALGVNPFTAPVEPRDFASGVEYSINVDTNADLAADATAKVTFSGNPLMFTIEGLGDPITGEVTPPGSAEAKVTEANGIKVFAGPRAEPIFQDVALFRFLAEPYVPENGFRRPGEEQVDLAPFNVSSIVIELPIIALTGAASSDTGTIKAWFSTSRGGSQIDRMAMPDIDNFLIPADQSDAFNQAEPANDEANYRATARSSIEAVRARVDPILGSAQDGGPLGDLTADQAAAALIPDVMTIDFSQPVQFPNGRRLQDDMSDIGVGILLNRGGEAGMSDGIDGSDKSFLTSFPYVGAPHLAPAEQAPVAQAPPVAGMGVAGDGGMGSALWLAIGTAIASLVLIGGGLYLRKESVQSN